jgi:hypothetical protein
MTSCLSSFTSTFANLIIPWNMYGHEARLWLISRTQFGYRL